MGNNAGQACTMAAWTLHPDMGPGAACNWLRLNALRKSGRLLQPCHHCASLQVRSLPACLGSALSCRPGCGMCTSWRCPAAGCRYGWVQARQVPAGRAADLSVPGSCTVLLDRDIQARPVPSYPTAVDIGAASLALPDPAQSLSSGSLSIAHASQHQEPTPTHTRAHTHSPPHNTSPTPTHTIHHSTRTHTDNPSARPGHAGLL